MRTFVVALRFVTYWAAGLSASLGASTVLGADEPVEKSSLFFSTSDQIEPPVSVWDVESVVNGVTTASFVELEMDDDVTLGESIHEAASSEWAKRTSQLGAFDSSSLVFADSIDFGGWNLVKWTFVVLVIAALAADRWRITQHASRTRRAQPPTGDPHFPNEDELRVLRSAVVDARCRIHLVGLGSRRFLLTTDRTGSPQLQAVHSWPAELVDLWDQNPDITAPALNESAEPEQVEQRRSVS